MSKNLKISYILTFVLFALCLAWNTLLNFFSGVGVTFAVMFALVLAMMVIIIVDPSTRKRFMDIFVLGALILVLEIVIFFALEFGGSNIQYLIAESAYGQSNIYTAMHVYQNVIACFAFVFLGYTIFRLICEIKNVRIGFVEVILGNQKIQKKERTSKELSNGSLSDKPNKAEEPDLDEEENEDQVIEITTPDEQDKEEE